MQHIDETDETIELLHSRVRILIDNAVAENIIIEDLVKEGHSEYYAQAIIDNIHKEKNDKKNLNSTLLLGLFITIGGVVFNIISYRTAAVNNSLFFYVFWGIVAGGISLILRAFIIYKK